ncbi:MAG: TldD/PmbA family protein, partial [Candidatus Acidiferrales bacterium]
EGQLVGDVQPLFTFGLSVVAEENGNRQSGSKNLGLRAGLEAFSVEDAQQLAREAVAQAAVLLTAEDAPAGELPVVLAPGASGVLLHESVGHPLEADANRKKLSVFSDRLGEKIATELCTVVDDATLPGLRGSLNVDGEGTVPQEPTVLIERGVLRGYLQDRLSARLMKMSPTGNGRRMDYSCIPIPRMTNTFLAAGTADPEEIVRSVERGIYCKAFSGGQVEPAVGKFTFSVHEAYLIENGRITKPIKGATLIGSGSEILQNIVAVGHDLVLDRGAWTCGKGGQAAAVGVGTPTVKIAKMTVGGRRAS